MMRYHPLTILFRIYNLIKSSLLFAIILFVVNRDSESWLFEYGRYAFVIIVLWRLIYIILAWFVEKYHWQDQTFHIYKGIFVKHTSTIPFSRIQNVTRKTTVFHKLVGLTSVTFETAMDGEDDSIHFEVLSKQHADFLLDLVQQGKGKSNIQDQVVDQTVAGTEQVEADNDDEPQESKRTIHFTPEKKDLWKASFTSLSFLAIIPIIFAVIDYLEPFLPETDEMESAFQVVTSSIWLLVAISVIAVIIAVGFGVIRTFIRYGKYEISSDDTHIYINRGLLNESYFAIEKKKIQGLEMTQSLMKRLFGLAEVKIISSASPKGGDEKTDVNSLYPFLPVGKAYQLIEEMLPIYQCDVELERLPRISLWVKLLSPSWLWIIATIALVYFKPNFFQIQQAWWIAIIVLFCLIVLHRVLDYMHTRYAVTGDQVQWWRGGLTTRMFITKRKNVIEMAYTQTRLQRYFHVASITTMNRSTPTRTEVINDIPFRFAQAMETWYLNRKEDIEIIGK